MARDWYYVVAWPGEEHNMVVLGPKDSEQEANDVGMTKLDVPYEVVSLPTSNRARATSMLKARNLERSGNLDQSLQRARHQ